MDLPQRLFNRKSQLRLLSQNSHQKPKTILSLANINTIWAVDLSKTVSSVERLDIKLHLELHRISYENSTKFNKTQNSKFKQNITMFYSINKDIYSYSLSHNFTHLKSGKKKLWHDKWHAKWLQGTGKTELGVWNILDETGSRTDVSFYYTYN